MSRSLHKVSVLIRDEISVFDSRDAAVTGCSAAPDWLALSSKQPSSERLVPGQTDGA